MSIWIGTTSEPETDVVDAPPWRDRRPVLIVLATVAVVVVAAILITVMAVSARGAARTAAAEEDAAALLAAHASAASADGDLGEVLPVAAAEVDEVFGPMLGVVGRERLATIDARGLEAATQKLRDHLERLVDRAPLAPLAPPLALADPVGADQPEEWTAALAAAYRGVSDDERSAARTAAARAATELERRAGTDAADLAAVTGALDAARAAVGQIVADAAGRAPQVAAEVELAPEAAVRAVIEAGETLGGGPTGPAAVTAVTAFAHAVDVAAEAHAVEHAAREKVAQEKAEREAAEAEREAAEAARRAAEAERRWGPPGWGGSWPDQGDLPWFP